MSTFEITSKFKPTGDQPQAIEKLVKGLNSGAKNQVLLGVTGSGKSVASSTPVLVRYNDGRILQVQIGEIIDRLFSKYTKKVKIINDSEILFQSDLSEGDQFQTYSLSPSSKLSSWENVTQLTRHQSPEELYFIKTKCGREITVTSNHNFFVLRQGKLILIPTTDIKKDDYLPMPLKLESNQKDLEYIRIMDFVDEDIFVDAKPFIEEMLEVRTRKEIINALHPYFIFPEHKYQKILLGQQVGLAHLSLSNVAQNLGLTIDDISIGKLTVGKQFHRYSMPNRYFLSSQFLRLLGYYIAEGHCEVKSRFFTISSNEAEVINDLECILTNLGLSYNHRNYDYSVASKLHTILLSKMLGSNSREKKLPLFWLNLSDNQLAELLRAYFEGDGGVWSQCGIMAPTASKRLASDLGYALQRFGIWTRTYKVWQRAYNTDHKGDYYWYVNISGKENLQKFLKYIGFVSTRKQDALVQVVKKCTKTQGDVIPGVGSMIREYRKILKLSLAKFSRLCGIKAGTLNSIECGINKPRRSNMELILKAFKKMPKDKGQLLNELEALMNCRWVVPSEIEQIKSQEKYVYDFSVDQNETFLAGLGGLYVHNTFSMANVIQSVRKPTLIISPNKTLAGQLAQEFRSIFPNNAVEYFVSYYDYYQPEAYIPSSDTYIEKDAQINEEIEKLRLSTTTSLVTRKDVVVVASVSAIYNLGSPKEYIGATLELKQGVRIALESVLKMLTKMFYQRNDIDFARATYRVKGDTLDIFPSYSDQALRVEFLGDKINRVSHLDPLTGAMAPTPQTLTLYPAKHYITPEQRIKPGIAQIEADLEERVAQLKDQNKLIEAQRIEQRTHYDLEMIKEFGYCNGIENYSRYFDGRAPGEPPYTLIDFFPEDYLIIVDESHITLPQIRGMYNGDRARKETLVDFGFRLPSALDNRPLKFEEFQRRINQAIYVSATPDEYELSLAGPDNIAEQLIRPTGIIDPKISIRPTQGQIEDVLREVKGRTEKGERVLITTLTKRMAEDLSEYLADKGIKVNYLHSDIETLKRADILQSLRLGEFDVLVGINLLREGLDLPEVSLVIILDADKEGFLRSRTSLVQTMGRAARHVAGEVIMYADNETKSMKAAIEEVDRRREYQVAYNKKHNITPKSIEKDMRDRLIEKVEELEEETGKKILTVDDIPPSEKEKWLNYLIIR